MKNESRYAKSFATLYRKVLASHGQQETPPRRDPIAQIVIGFLEWNATAEQALAAYDKIMEQVVDFNDLRVSHPYEVVAIIGQRYPQSEERTARLREVLQEIYHREHAVSMDKVSSKGKKQVRAYLESLPGMTPYVAAQTALLCFDVHAVAVDDTLLALLRQEDAIPEDATAEDCGSFLERQIKAADSVQAHTAFRAWADEHADKVESRPARKPAKKPVAKAATKKATTKKTTKKATTKKTTKKAVKKAKA